MVDGELGGHDESLMDQRYLGMEGDEEAVNWRNFTFMAVVKSATVLSNDANVTTSRLGEFPRQSGIRRDAGLISRMNLRESQINN